MGPDPAPIRSGDPHSLGAVPTDGGVNFAVYSSVADTVELCLFDESGRERRLTLPGRHRSIHHGFVPGLRPGQAYGFRANGPWDPGAGLRCNPAKLLLDPYARAISGRVTWETAVFGHRPSDPRIRSRRDSAPHVPRSVVVGGEFDWQGDTPPDTPLSDTIVYEAHVKGMTMRHPDVPPDLRGTYAGLASPPIIEYLVRLGITAIELLPVHHFVDEHHLHRRGLTNYWGYNSIGFFAPHAAYASGGEGGGQVTEFKEMVRTFHEAGIEVLLDVVYNHTAESNHLGPTFSFKGLDNPAYYVLADDRARYIDHTGTGSSLNVDHPAALRLVMDSLRYWVEEMHVDGFRFDLASTLGRRPTGFDPRAPFFEIIRQDPILQRTKLIAEPWDVGPGGYQVGGFPAGWSEWNDRYRSGVRDYWRGWDETLADFASRFSGSSDLFEAGGRTPTASVNYLTAHDGFTLADLVAYNEKHNDANGEDGRDGDENNRSWNSGAEGPTDDEAVLTVRRTRARSMLTTLFLSQGIPMLLAGDEIGRTQRGNNNAYSQDNDVSWLDWKGADEDLLAFTRRLIALRRDHHVFRRTTWFADRGFEKDGAHEIDWFKPDGAHMTVEDWRVGYAKSLAVHLHGGETDTSFLILFNSGGVALEFTLPADLVPLYGDGHGWAVELATTDVDAPDHLSPGDQMMVAPWAVVLLRLELE